MKVLYSIVQQDYVEEIKYTFEGQRIHVQYENGLEDAFDFSNVPNGKLDPQTIKSELPHTIDYAEKVNGELYIVLVKHLPLNAPEEELNPDWFDTETGERFPTNEHKDWILER